VSLNITFLGTGAAMPSVHRNVSSLAIQREGETLIFDCGEGTQRQMMRYGVGFSFTEIFFSHFHADHMLGVIGLVRTMGLLDRTAPLTLHGPKGAKRVLGAALGVGIERNKFPVEIVEVQPGDVLKRDEYDLAVFPTEHRADTIGWALVEHIRKGRFDPELARELGVPEGPLWGRIHRGEHIRLDDGREIGPEQLVGPARPGRKVVYSGDTRPVASLVEAARGADLLVHEATFIDEEKDRAVETGHSTAREAGRVAREAGVRQLVLTHISPRYTRDAPEILAEAHEEFQEVTVARDGMVVDVGFRSDVPGHML
jgi:ribonuclease Z